MSFSKKKLCWSSLLQINYVGDLTDETTMNYFTPATLSTSPNIRRLAGDFAVFWKTVDLIEFFPIIFTNRIKGSKVFLNTYLCCDDLFLISLYGFQSNKQDIWTFLKNEPFDDIFIISDLNAHPFNEIFFFNIFEKIDFQILPKIYDVMQIPAAFFHVYKPTILIYIVGSYCFLKSSISFTDKIIWQRLTWSYLYILWSFYPV